MGFMGDGYASVSPQGIVLMVYGYGSIPINTIFRGLFTSINPSYFDVNYRGTIGFDTLPYGFTSKNGFF